MRIKGVAISDLHFGIPSSDKLYTELEFFLNYIQEKELDFININGDYFDRKISLNESACKLALKFFDRLFKICKDKNIKLRMIQGTKSHDLNQLDNFFHYQSDSSADFKIYTTATIEDIHGMKIAYFPEEYPENHEEYFEAFRDTPIDIMHGHGLWSFVSFFSKTHNQGERLIKSAPIFDLKEWKNLKGFALFGHIHQNDKLKNKVFYCSSYTRWMFGDEREKGFLYYEYNTDTSDYVVEFVENKEAPLYVTKKIKDEVSSLSIETITEYIENISNENTNVRIDTEGLSEDILLQLKKTTASNNNVKLENKNTIVKPKTSLDDEYSFIVKRTVPINEAIKKFIKMKFEKDIPIEKINDIIKRGS